MEPLFISSEIANWQRLIFGPLHFSSNMNGDKLAEERGSGDPSAILYLFLILSLAFLIFGFVTFFCSAGFGARRKLNEEGDN